MEVYDLAIIGSGPAGISAALTAKARNLNFIWFGKKELSIKIEKAERINNYPGFFSVTGEQLKEAFSNQIESEELTIIDKNINQVFKMGKLFAIFSGQESWQAKTVIFCMGTAPANTMKGETEFLGRGVSYCATCDGRLYQGRRIAVVCTSPKYEEEVEFLADLADKVILFVSYKGCGISRDNVQIINGLPKEITGEQLVNGIKSLKDFYEVDGVFCLKDAYSPASILNGLEMDNNHIKVDRVQETNIKGCYAAGDCTGRPYQYAKAIGEGNVAMHSAVEYLSKLDEK